MNERERIQISQCPGRRRSLRQWAWAWGGALAIFAFAAGCSGSSDTATGPGQVAGSGGVTVGGVVSTGGTGAGIVGTGGKVAAPSSGAGGSPSGAISGGGGAGGSNAVEASAGGSTGSVSRSGGAPGSSGASGTGGRVGGTATGGGGRNSNASGGGGGAVAVAGTGGGAGAVTGGPLTVPVVDSASKVPISNAGAGYKVEGNFAYGPLTAQRLDVIYPTSAGPKGTQVLPVVLMFHGGAWIHSYTNNYGSGKDHMSTFFSRFLAHGFMVCNAEYRVNDQTPDGAVAPAAVEDALLAAKWCWDHLDYFHGDKSRFVVTGASAGGHLALMVGMTTPAAKLGPTAPADFQIAGVISGYGPADIEAELNGVASGWIPTSLPNRAAVAKLVNPMTYVRKEVPPLIVVQGSNDNTAPVADSRRLVANLKAAGADATMHEVPGAGHGYTTVANGWDNAEKAMFDWLTAKGIGK